MEVTSNRIQWIKTGAICGLLGGLMYFSAAFISMPDLAVYVAAFSFGPLLAIGCVGIYYFLADKDKSPRLQIAVVCAIAGGVVLLMMLTVQQSIFALGSETTGVSANQGTDKKITDSLNSIHWGMDVAWDMLISAATILFGWSMVTKSGLWKFMGAIGTILGILLLVFNLYFFPNPPASADSTDWGPFVAIWYLVVFILLLKRPRTTDNRP